MAYIIDADGYIVTTDPEAPILITALDGTDDTTAPQAITRVDAAAQSANQVHQLIDGSIAVTVVGDLLPAGTLTLVYVSDTQAAAARALLARATSFSLVHPRRPVVNMTFVRDGQLNAPTHDTVAGLWNLQVGYQEVIR